MSSRIFVTIFFLSFSVPSFSQTGTNEILGHYMSPEKNSIFRFYKSGQKYYGKLVWMKYPERHDTLNPNKDKRTRKILGTSIAWDFIFDGKNSWNKGYIYDANSGKTYKAKIIKDKDNNLLVRGYVGVQLIGKTEYFVKMDFKE